MSSTYPDSPEAVALSLFEQIVKEQEEQQEDRRRNAPKEHRAREMLDLYAQCLAAIRGHRAASDLTLH
jgi:hypothetical protein